MKFIKNHFNIILILICGFFLRIQYLITQSGNLSYPNLGGDPCHHYNTAINVAKNFIPQNDFIFSYWFHHQKLPALIDIYPPGFYLVLGSFLYLFGEEYFIARIFNLIIGLLNILLAFLLGSKIKSYKVGIVSAFIVSFNIFHIENSTVVMNVLFPMMMIQLCFLLFLYVNKNIYLWFLLGLIVGYSYLTLGSTLVIFIFINFYIFYQFYYKNKLFKKSILIFITFFIGFFLILLPWGIITYNYFGTIFYSNLNFYPYTSSFSNMMYETVPPSLKLFLSENSYLEILINYFYWTLKNLYQGSLYLVPTIFFPFFIFLIPLILINSINNNLKSNIFLISIIFIFLLTTVGSNATGGILWPRHYVPMLSIISVLLAISVVNVFNKYLYKYLFIKIEKFIININYLNISLIIAFTIMTSVGLIYKDNYVSKSFWSRDSSSFYKFGEWIKENTNKNDIIMYGLTPQDAWCATNRKIVGDPLFHLSKDSNRVIQEINHYNVDYLWIDLSKHIYQRDDKIENIIKLYKEIDLKLIYSDNINKYYFYKID